MKNEFVHLTTEGTAEKTGHDSCLGNHAMPKYGNHYASHRYPLLTTACKGEHAHFGTTAGAIGDIGCSIGSYSYSIRKKDGNGTDFTKSTKPVEYRHQRTSITSYAVQPPINTTDPKPSQQPSV